VGTVTVNGIETKDGETTFSLEFFIASYDKPTDISLEYPPFAEGEMVTFTASGTETVPAFTLSASAISPIEVLNETITMEDGQPIHLQWTPPASPDNTTIFVAIDISHHGGTKGVIECDCEDNGSLEIAATLCDQLKARGVSGYPRLEITRKSVGTSEGAPADLVIESGVSLELIIPGLISCPSPGDTTGCPPGQTCQADFKCGDE
jgi:hypothetical protein